jgi:hypothetical protein
MNEGVNPTFKKISRSGAVKERLWHNREFCGDDINSSLFEEIFH